MDTSDNTTLTLTDEEAYVLKIALETFCDREDGSYRKAVTIADTIFSRLPHKTKTVWKDISS